MQSAGLVEGYRRSFSLEADFSLTRREREILRLVAQGKRNKEIGNTLGISICTVKIHLSNIFFKLGVSRRSEAVEAATLQGRGA